MCAAVLTYTMVGASDTIFQALQEQINLFARTTWCDPQSQVWTVKARMKKSVRIDTKLAADILGHSGCSGRG